MFSAVTDLRGSASRVGGAASSSAQVPVSLDLSAHPTESADASVQLCQLKALEYARNGAPELALAAIERAILLDPLNVRSHFLAGRLAEESCDFERAQAYYARAVELDPADKKAMFHQCLNHFSLGRWTEGAKGYGSRPLQDHRDSRVKLLPRWTGGDAQGLVLLWAEQGLGDEILFLRFLPVIREHWGRLLIEVDSRLRGLYESNFPDIRFMDRGAEVPLASISAQAPHGDLVSLFHQRMTEPIFSQHCLQVPADEEDCLQRVLGVSDGRQRVGISWLTMSSVHPELRSIPLKGLLSALDPAKHVIVNIQYSATERDLQLIEDLGFTLLNKSEINCHQDLFRLSVLISALDMVLTIDNSTAHLAGTLGVDTSVLLPRLANWRWGNMRSTPLWYSKQEIFSQQELGDWSSPLRKLEFKLHLWTRASTRKGARHAQLSAPSVQAARKPARCTLFITSSMLQS